MNFNYLPGLIAFILWLILICLIGMVLKVFYDASKQEENNE